jgi:DNA polymerase/3'-5' exonuclease PolX
MKTAQECKEVMKLEKQKEYSSDYQLQGFDQSNKFIGESIASSCVFKSNQNESIVERIGFNQSQELKLLQTNSMDQIKVMFIELGRGLTKSQIRILSDVVIKKGAKVVSALQDMPTYMVVDAHINVEVLASHLKFRGVNKVRKLEQLISNYNVTPVKPIWITNTRGPKLLQPKLMELYNGLILSTTSETSSQKMHSTPSARRIGNLCRTRQGSNTNVSSISMAATRKRKSHSTQNQELVELFRKLSQLHQNSAIDSYDEYRAYTFQLVAGRLSQIDIDIRADPSSMTALRSIPGLCGSTTLRLIEEWRRTGTVERLCKLEMDDQRIAIRNLIQIWGVGPKIAKQMVQQNIRSIEHVRERLASGELTLSDNQRVGVDCYEDFMKRIPRQEVEQLLEIIKEELIAILPNATVAAMGSYRRGKVDCGDADFLITDSNYKTCTPRSALALLIRKLMKKGYIAHNLTTVDDVDNEMGRISPENRSDTTIPSFQPYYSSQSYMGVFLSPSLPGVRRRVDIKFYPNRERAFATLYFTGCGWFNRSMRLWATRKANLVLNDHGFFPVSKWKQSRHSTYSRHDDEGHYLEASSEMKIFDRLGLMYKEPHERNYFDDVLAKDGSTVSSLDVDDKASWKLEHDITQSGDNGSPP